jgi:FKBP-type peptidyl-prolyl cis-trans isomerase (trigger factor)
MISALKRNEDQTLELTVTIPWERVKKEKDKLVQEYAQTAKIPGFRPGKAPTKLAEENIDKAKLNEEVLKKLLPQTYIEAVGEHNLKPFINPKIHVEKLEDDKDWQYMALTCEVPEIDLGGYKEAVKSLTAKQKIVIPGKESEQVNFDEISKALLENVKVKIPKILLEQEADRLLAQTLDEVKRLGLTLDQYLSSTQRTPQNLREEYEGKAESDIKFELALQKIAEVEGIKVEEKEIEEAIKSAKSEDEKKNLETNRYLLASILRQQKTLDFIKNL